MQVIAICLGLLSCICLSECVITGWTTPSGGSTADYAPTTIMYLTEGNTAIITPVATTGGSITGYVLEDQTVTDFFEIATAATGVITLKGSNVLDADATTLTHVLKIKATDDASAASGTVTITFSILGMSFSYDNLCLFVTPTAALGTIFTNALSSTGTYAVAIASGNTDTDFGITGTTGVVANLNALTTTSGTSGKYTLVMTGSESIGTASTVTSTVTICMRGSSCVCTTPSAAAHITAGLLGIFATLIMMLLK